jgi:5'-deoxynucleotidase YfbR-like HD superfamily hydrolase
MNSSNEMQMLEDMKCARRPTIKIIEYARRMRDVRRLAGFQTIRNYSDAEHCYYTGLLFMEIAKEEKLDITLKQIEFVFLHDILEILTGDLLYPAKNTNSVTKEAWDIIEREVEKTIPDLFGYAETTASVFFSPSAWALFKDCDALELWICCNEEKRLGNVMYNADSTTVEDTMFNILKNSQFKTVLKRIGIAI